LIKRPNAESAPSPSPGPNSGYGAAFLMFDGLRELNDSYIVNEIQLSRPELAFIIATRAMIGAGIALLLADRLSPEQRKAVGASLALVGLVTTIPAVWAIFGKCE
jgi:hypothetical protein